MKRLGLAVIAAAALWAAACGSGGATITPPPPTGKYSLGSLSGTYAFMTSGEVFTNGSTSAASMARVGSFIADGKGGITGGVEDVNSLGSPSGALTITGGSYTVNADGRGTLRLNFGPSSINFAIVLTSTSDGLMIDETSTSTQASTGSGNFIKQDTALCGSPVNSVAGTYVFDFAGLDSSRNPESFVGEFTANNGATTANFGDLNDNMSLSSGAFTASFATDLLHPAGADTCGRGLAQISTQTYAFYVVDSRRVRFINAAGGEMLSGDAVRQTNVPASVSSLNSGFVFVVAGSSASGGLTRVGRFTASGSTVTNILMDVNDAGSFRQPNTFTNASITFDPSTGRGTVSFQDSIPLTYTFVFYLSSGNSGVIQDVSPSSTIGFARDTADGSILAQSGSPFTSSNVTGPYALNWSGLVVKGGTFPTQDEEDLLAQARVSSLALSGTADIFQFTSATLTPQTDIGTAGQITFNNGDGTGDDRVRVDMTVNLSNTSPINMVIYIVNPQLAFFANRDNSGTQRIVVGILKAQQ